jgi:hypothetical protein
VLDEKEIINQQKSECEGSLLPMPSLSLETTREHEHSRQCTVLLFRLTDKH